MASPSSLDATLRLASQALARTLATIARSRQLLAASEGVLEEARAVLSPDEALPGAPCDGPGSAHRTPCPAG